MKRDVIIALDFKDGETALNFLDKFQEEKPFVKVGMELFFAEGPSIVKEIKRRGHKIFLDLKLHDIPNTVGHSVASVTRLGVNLITVHAAGGRAMMQAATRYAKITADELGVERPKILAVTVLTSFDDQGWQEVGGHLPIQEHVLELASLAKSSGVDGVVASPKEAGSIREMAGKDDFLIVTPGIRPSFAQTDDQKRIATPSQAFKDGSSMLVIGRPITQAIDPCAAARLILKEIKENA